MTDRSAERAGDRSAAPVSRFLRDDGTRIAYAYTPGRAPTTVFFSGYSSDMSGTKARYLEAQAKARGRAFLRFDYQGHGESGGSFVDGDVGLWSEDARALIEHVTAGPLVLVGSSMGAWIMLIVALALPARVAALVGIASAPDFSEDLILPALNAAQRAALEDEGAVHLPSRYGEAPQVVSRRFIEHSRRHLLLHSEIQIECPVRLLHGLEDPDVPWQTSVKLARVLRSGDVQLTLIKDGDHRLSTPRDLAGIDHALESLIDSLGGGALR